MGKKKYNHTTIDVDNNKELRVHKIEADYTEENDKEYKELKNKGNYSVPKKKNSFFVSFLLFLVLITSIGYFAATVIYKNNDVDLFSSLIEGVLLVLFSILFIVIAHKSHAKKKGSILLGAFLLLLYQGVGIVSMMGIFSFSTMNKVIDFRGRSLTDVVSWASKNNIEIKQEYEYSDMISEYSIISQNVDEGTKIKDIKNLTVAVSEGANPSKEMIVPNMVSWDSERVLEFIKENYLSKVEVEFVESDKQKDTVIEQSKSGNLKRDDEIKLTFSAGEKFDEGEVKLIDFTGKSKFEVTFYLKQHRIRYDFEDQFSKKIKRGYVTEQSIKPGTMVKIDDEKVIVKVSKGPEIKIPDLKKMSMTEITNWIIKNKLKLEFTDRYDDSAKDNEVLEVNYSTGDVVEQNTLIKIVLSKGKLKMPKFTSLTEFREWADKYSIKYEEKYEFSDSVKSGEVISYSYKTGDVIKNNDSIVVTISDGEKLEVPDLKGMTKSDIISKLKKLGLNYNFVYKSDKNIAKDKAISQSISAGSDVSKGTTITITLSSGKSTSTGSGGSNSNSGNNSGSGSGGGNSGGQDKPSPPSCTSTKEWTLIIQPNWVTGGSANSTISTLSSKLKDKYPLVKFNFTTKPGNSTAGYIHDNSPITSGSIIKDCQSYTIIVNE